MTHNDIKAENNYNIAKCCFWKLRFNLEVGSWNSEFCKRNPLLIIALILIFFFLPSSLSKAKTFEDIEPEYCISYVQAIFLPWWEDEWEETLTGFRIRGSSFDLPTLHILQHWKGRIPFNDLLFFSFNYFTDADEDSQFYKQEMELKWRIKGRNYISLFGYPYYDKKQSDIGIRYSFEETPFDFIKLSILFENAPNNYTFKNRDMDSMRIYEELPIQFSLDASIIKKANTKLIISYNYEFPYSANYENQDGEILNKTKGERSDISIEVNSIFSDSSRWGWKIDFSYKKKKYLSHSGNLDSISKSTRIRPNIYLDKRINRLYNLIMLYNYDHEQNGRSVNITRKTFLLGIVRNFHSHSKIGLSYCNGLTDNIIEDMIRKDNRLILSAEHRFKNKARLGMNLGIELDTRDVTHGLLGRYDKLFFFLQYPIK